jgi:hypothetical protein
MPRAGGSWRRRYPAGPTRIMSSGAMPADVSESARERGRKGNKKSAYVRLKLMDRQSMMSNIEPIAREITRSICRDNQMPETQIEQWVNLHWQCAAAMLEAGVMDETGEWIEGKDWRRGLEAYRERFLASSASEAAAVGNDSF